MPTAPVRPAVPVENNRLSALALDLQAGSLPPSANAAVATLLDGKPVIGSLREIQEARNAIKAYDRYESWSPGSEKDLLRAHGVLMAGLFDQPGSYRRGGVAVGGAGVVHHVAPPAGRVPELMAALK